MVGNVKLKHRLDCGDLERVEFEILKTERRAQSKLIILDSRRADFGLFKGLPGRVLWDGVLEESCVIFKDFLLQAQKQCFPTKKKPGKKSRKLVWMNKDKQEDERRDRDPGRNTEK